MKSIIFLLFAISSGYFISAQEQYIEVVVTDTIIFEPKEWNYFLILQTKEETGTSEVTVQNKISVAEQDRIKASRRRLLDSLRRVAINLGGEVTGDPDNPLNFTLTPISYSGHLEPQFLNIRFTNRQAIENFVRAVNKRGDIEGRITSATHPDMPPFTDRLNAKIVSKGKQKAATLAQLAGRTLGSVILISEVAEADKDLYHSLFEKMIEADRTSWLPGWHTQSPDYPTDRIKLEKTLRLRFALQ